jgi:hypothetical protein
VNKVNNQRERAASYQGQGDQIDFLGGVVASRAFLGGMVSVLLSKDKGDSAFGSRRVVRGDDFAIFQTGSAKVSVVNLSSIESARSWGTPSGVSAGFGNNSERVLGDEVDCSQPADLDSLEWIMNLDSLAGVDNFGANYENPEQSTGCEGVAEANPAISYKACVEEGKGSTQANQGYNRQVSPAASGAINVIIGHVSNTTSTHLEKSEYLLTKKGN